MNPKAKELLDKAIADLKEKLDQAALDLMIYGTVIIKLNDDGTVNHIPYGTEIPDDLTEEEYLSGVSSRKRGPK